MTCNSTSINLVSVVPLNVPRGAVRSYTVTCVTNEVNATTGKVTTSRADLTSAVVEFTVHRHLDTPSDEDPVIFKSSDDVAEVAILTQSGATMGQAVIKLVAADTEDLDTECPYVYEVWVTLADGRSDAIIDVSPFKVDQRVPRATPAL